MKKMLKKMKRRMKVISIEIWFNHGSRRLCHKKGPEGMTPSNLTLSFIKELKPQKEAKVLIK